MLAGPVGSMALDIFKQVAGGLLNKTGDGSGLFSSNIPVSLPNPLSRLNGLLSGIGGGFNNVGDFLNRIGDFLSGRRNVGGQDVTVPRLGDRAGAVSSYSSALSGQVAGGSYDAALNPALSGLGRGGGADNPFSSGLSKDQTDMLNSIEDPKQRARMAIQMKLQNQSELTAFVSNLMKLLHDSQMQIIRNIQA
ncbi:MAG: hypothetical protein HYZ28_28365 [Myxococcales bacterium]|nr:hypothetical protein [Myxococcales bacterium]